MSILRRFTHFILTRRSHGLGIIFLIAFIPYVGSVSVLIASLITLRKGALEGLLAFIAASLPVILTYLLAGVPLASGSMAIIALNTLIMSYSIMWIFAVLLRRYASWGLVLECGLLMAIVTIGALHLAYPDLQAWWQERLTDYFNKAAVAMEGLAKPNGLDQTKTVQLLSQYASGLMAASILFNTLLHLTMARWWQALVFNPGGLRKELYNVRLSAVTGIAFIVFVYLAYNQYSIALETMPIFFVVLCMSALSLLHFIIAQHKHRMVWLIIAYGIMIITFPRIILLLSCIAVLDIGINFRRRFYAHSLQ